VEKLLTPKELSAFTSLRLSTIYSLSYKRKLPFIKLGNRLRFRQSDVERWVKQGEVFSDAPPPPRNPESAATRVKPCQLMKQT